MRGGRSFVEPRFAQRFDGLMHRGHPTVGTGYGARLSSAEAIDAWLAVAKRGDRLVTHPSPAEANSRRGCGT